MKGMTPALPTVSAYQQEISALFGERAGEVLAKYPASAYPTPEKAYIAVYNDGGFICPARALARAGSAGSSAAVYRYFFTEKLDGPLGVWGAFHTLELGFVFDTLGSHSPYTTGAAQRALIEAIEGYWSQLADTGSPSAQGAPSWARRRLLGARFDWN